MGKIVTRIATDFLSGKSYHSLVVVVECLNPRRLAEQKARAEQMERRLNNKKVKVSYSFKTTAANANSLISHMSGKSTSQWNDLVKLTFNSTGPTYTGTVTISGLSVVNPSIAGTDDASTATHLYSLTLATALALLVGSQFA